ncbi:hypothetical protein Prudu_009104 [Prunus dulcis]|uniref:Reverse transcriptase domain-containing protein n=1 Tax=Prunus dulcis TaxID=3755 RepID=A0A4Y1R5L0_PRUDU|nr:hypothetical protein Prudu_009104 [Prunus dulcis]
MENLNELTIKDKYPIPLIDDMLDELQWAKVAIIRLEFIQKILKKQVFGLTRDIMNSLSLSWYFFDDILIYSTSWSDHLRHLHTVLEILKHHQLFVKMSKCAFGVSTIEYLGHIISRQGVSVDPSKLKAIADWPVPTSVKSLRGFLGLTGYYRKFIPHYDRESFPLLS